MTTESNLVVRMEATLQHFAGVLQDIMERLDKSDARMDDLLARLPAEEDDPSQFQTPTSAKERIPPTTETFGRGVAKASGGARRNTIWDDVTSKRELDVPTMIFERKPYDGVRMDELKISKVLKFIDDVNRYMASTGVNARIGTLFTNEAKNQLISKSEGRLKPGRFYQEDPITILTELQIALRPGNSGIFIAALEENVEFITPKGFFLKATNIETFYDAILEYQQKFSFVCQFLAKDNLQNVPPATMRKGGLIKVFVSKIPFGYGERVVATMAKSSYDNLDTFLDDFLPLIREHKNVSNRARDIMFFFNFSHVPEEPQFGRVKKEERIKPSVPDPRRESKPKDWTRVAAVDVVPASDEHSLEEMSHNSSRNDFYAVEGSEEALLAAVTKEKQDKSSLPCFAKLFKHSCPNEHSSDPRKRCTYNHDDSFLAKHHAIYMDQLRSSPYNKKLLFLEDRDEEYELAAIENLYRKVPNLEVMEHLTIGADVLLSNGEVVSLKKEQVLLDTGARGANFVSADFVRAHKEYIITKPFVRPRVTAMANKSPMTADAVAHMELRFRDDKGQAHLLKGYFLVTENLSLEIIVGMIDIAIQLPTLFLELHTNGFAKVADQMAQVAHLTQPWSSVSDIEAPEEGDLPASFPYALRFMEMTRDEAVQEYTSMFKDHVSEEFLAYPGVKELLETLGVQVFVPSNWDGISGVPPLELNWKSGMPEFMKPKARPISPLTFATVKKEYGRLGGYFYEPSDSPIASCLVVAPKATPPFLRLCGDYTQVNKYVERGHYPIPIVKHELAKIIEFPFYLDLDLTNAFHQIRLGPDTSRKLSIVTPWGQVQPRFLPEGVSPASGILQKIMSQIFKGFEDFSIVIFDNLLILARDLSDALTKLRLVLERCIQHNVVLKFSKSFLGFNKVHFFGYDCSHKHFELSNKRKGEINAFEFPTSQKEAQRFLGTAIFFSGFVPNFAHLCAPISELTSKNFNWDRASWKRDYEADFALLKEALTKACAVYYPDYNLDWVLRTDASDLAVGAVLIQRAIRDDQSVVEQPLGFASQKFSAVARNWTTYEKESYGIFYGVKYFEYFLRCKHFVVESDHRNLRWMESSLVPKVIRWRMYLQSFSFLVRDIPGRLNVVADWQSRPSLAALSPSPLTINDLIRKVHGGRSGHHGARRTWHLLNEYFPGHRVRYIDIAEFVENCPVCQKSRILGSEMDKLQPVIRHLKVPHAHHTFAIDVLSVTPVDSDGYGYLIVVVNLFTRFTVLYPSKDKTALAMANAIFHYVVYFGACKYLRSDPGSDLTSESVRLVNTWFGIHHSISIVDRPESNGVEPVNKAILRFLRGVVFDERLVRNWSSPSVLNWVAYQLNSFLHSEAGVVPYEATFGSTDLKYFSFMGSKPTSSTADKSFASELTESLALVRKIALDHQSKIVQKRLLANPAIPTLYKEGDLVLLRNDNPASKLQPKFLGPFEVLGQISNDVRVKHVIRHTVSVVHVEKLKIFRGSLEDAKKLAQLDFDEHHIDRFLAYRGNPLKRTSMEFFVLFSDGDKLWLPWSKDLFATMQYEEFCKARRELEHLVLHERIAYQWLRNLSKEKITAVAPNDEVYVDLRSYGSEWYDTLSLPDLHEKTYYILFIYKDVDKVKNKIQCFAPVFSENFWVTNEFVYRYGSIRTLPVDGILVSRELANKFPEIKPSLASLTVRYLHLVASNLVLLHRP